MAKAAQNRDASEDDEAEGVSPLKRRSPGVNVGVSIWGRHSERDGAASPGGRRLSALGSIVNRKSFRTKVPTEQSVLALEELAKQEGGSRFSTGDLTHIKRLGEGAFATVDLCTLPVGDGGGEPVPVAVKKLRRKILGPPTNPAVPEEAPMVDAPPSWRNNFLAEVVMMSAMRHPNLVACYGILADNESSFLLEFCDGGTLLDKLRKPSSYQVDSPRITLTSTPPRPLYDV